MLVTKVFGTKMAFFFLLTIGVPMVKVSGGYILVLRTILLVALVTHLVTLFHKGGLLLCKSILALLWEIPKALMVK
jgi:hypothetical protein